MSESPLGSPISSSGASPLPQKISQNKPPGELQGRKAVPLSTESDSISSSSDSLAGSPVAKQASQIERTSDKVLPVQTEATQIASKEVQILSEDDLDALMQIADQLVEQNEPDTKQQGSKTVASEIQALFNKLRPDADAEQKANVVAADHVVDSRLIDAYHAGDIGKIKELLESGISIDARNSQGETLLDVVLQTIRHKGKESAHDEIEFALSVLNEKADSSKVTQEEWKLILDHSINQMSLEDFNDLDLEFDFPSFILAEKMQDCLMDKNWQGVEKLHRLGVPSDFIYQGATTLAHAYKQVQETGDLTFITRLIQLLPSQKVPYGMAKDLLERIESQGRLSDAPQPIFQPLIENALQRNDWNEIFTLLAKGASAVMTYSGDKLMNHAYVHAKNTNDLIPILVFLKKDATDITLSETECKDLLERLFTAGRLKEAPAELIIMVFKHLPIESIADVKNPAWMAALTHVLTSDKQVFIKHQLNQAKLDTLFLEFAKTEGNEELIKTLIMLGANIEKQDAHGNTALHLALKNSDLRLMQLLLKHGANYAVLNAAIQTPLDLAKPRIRSLISIQEERLNRRFHALRLDPLLEARKISDREIRQLAYMIEYTIPEISQQIGKIHKGQTGIQHSLLYRKEATDTKAIREVYVLLQKAGTIKGSGASKKASEAIKLPLDLVKDVAERTAMVITKKDLKPHELDAVIKELAVYDALKDLPGIWPQLSVCDFTAEFGSEVKRRIAIMAIPGTASFYDANLDQVKVVRAARQIAQGLAGMHARGYCHGDFKGQNALVGADGAGVIDFGFTRQIKAGDKAFFPLSYGFYGSIFCTAPELFGNQQFAELGGNYSKLDVFAYGDMLYRKHFHPTSSFESQTPWCSLLMKYRENFGATPVSAEDKTQFQALLEQHVQIPLTKLEMKAAKEPLTKEEQLQMVIFKALYPDPAKRATMAELLKDLAKIESQ